jgi:hypothetical protein
MWITFEGGDGEVGGWSGRDGWMVDREQARRTAVCM